MTRYVIVGSGVAAITAVQAIRQEDAEAPITLISEDPFGYYSRPGLAYLLTGEIPEDYLFPYQELEIERLNLQQILGRVKRILVKDHQLSLDNGQWLPYDRLLLATGSTAALPDTPGIGLEGVVKLDSLQDAREIMARARKKKSAVVVGGGITALEFVEGLKCLGCKVHYFLRGEHYWSNVLDTTESEIVEQRLEEEGVVIHRYTELKEILGNKGRVEAVITQAGEMIKAGMVAVAIGIRPRIELAQASSIATERGILVNEHMQTSHPDIFAAGDVAQVYDPASGKHILDSLWGPAREQGKVAGMNMAGGVAVYLKPSAFNVTRLAGITTTIIGSVGRGRDADLISIAHGDSENWRQSPDAMIAQTNHEVNRVRVLVGKEKLLGAIVMGDQSLSQPLQELIVGGADISPIREQMLQPGASLRVLLSNYWIEWKGNHAA